EWVEDSTNASDAYLRNQLRRRISRSLPDENRQHIAALWRRQIEVKRAIDDEASKHLRGAGGEYSRYFFTHSDAVVALELLRAVAVEVTGSSLTRPQLERLLLAIKTARPGTRFP